MPEGAECKIIGENLARLVGTRKCVAVTPLSGRYLKKEIPGLGGFEPSKVVAVGVKGKLIFWIFRGDTYLFNTLGMTGSWSSNGDHKHARVRFDFDRGDPVYFIDIRNFGTLKFVRGKRSFLKKLDSLGHDLLSEYVTNEQFIQALDKRPHWTIAKALMDQTMVCGVGNYVKAEALYRSKVSPHRLVGSLTSDELSSIRYNCQTVLRQAYESNGASIKTYRTPKGEAGRATLEFQVYGRRHDPAGNEVVREKTDDGRTTHWVPAVQR